MNSLDLKKTVNLFCRIKLKILHRRSIREYNVPSAGNIQFKVVTKTNQVYLIFIKTDSNQIPINPVDAVDKSVQSKNVKPRKLANGTWEVKLPNQSAIYTSPVWT